MDIVQKFRLRGVRHCTQIDPANEDKNTDSLFKLIGNSGTDAVIYAGSEGVSTKNLLTVLERSKKYISQIKVVAPSSPEVTDVRACKKILYSNPPLADAILPYVVLNSTDPKFVNALHKDWYSSWYSEDEEIPTGKIREIPYIVISQKGTIRRKVPIDEDFSVKNIVGYATIGAMRSSVHGIPLLYIETTGYDKNDTGIEPTEYIRACRDWTDRIGFSNLYLISGGEVRDENEARRRIEAGADAINVGNPLYFNDQQFGHSVYLSTIRGVKPEITLDEHKKLYEKLYSVTL